MIILYTCSGGHQQQYKLQINSGSMKKMELRRKHDSQKSQDQRKLLVLIELSHAPMIYKNIKKPPKVSSDYFATSWDILWERSTDFSPSSFIGQSSALCIEVSPQDVAKVIPYFVDKNYADLEMRRGLSYCSDGGLIPIVHQNKLSFDVLFRVNMLLHSSRLVGPTLDASFFEVLVQHPMSMVEWVLKQLSLEKECCYDPTTWLKNKLKCFKDDNTPHRQHQKDEYLVRCVIITPSKVYFKQQLQQSNRVFRKFKNDIDSFLQVQFRDENFSPLKSFMLLPPTEPFRCEPFTDIYRQVQKILQDGLEIGGRKFELLAYSASQLRNTSLWMFAPSSEHTATDVRKWMGDFKAIRNVSKFSARLGQSFSSSIETLEVATNDVSYIDDIEVEMDGVKYNFSDGIGRISSDFARDLAESCRIETSPSAFQIRYGGVKGVVAIYPKSKTKLTFRQSMMKFSSDYNKVDVISWSKPAPFYLNRQLITLLTSLSVKEDVFLEKQENALKCIDMLQKDPVRALNETAIKCGGARAIIDILRKLILVGFDPRGEKFISKLLENIYHSELSRLRKKTHIFIPKGRHMMGCLDETKTLTYGQVFVQISDFEGGKNHIVTGRVFIAKCPCLHPGDLIRVDAVDVPELHCMVDCVVFPQQGQRPHPNECSGSDLDGDLFYVCWDEELIPPESMESLPYASSASKTLDRLVQIEDVKNNFLEYVLRDNIGLISNAHVAFADVTEKMASSSECLQLAQLFSIAIDSAKTGEVVELPKDRRVVRFPHFMEFHAKEKYESKGTLGKLYHMAKQWKTISERSQSSYDKEMEVYGFAKYIDEAISLKEHYDSGLMNLMAKYEVENETQFILMYKGDFETLTHEVQQKFEKWGSDNELAKASACYHVTHSNDNNNEPGLIGFPLCIYDKLIKIKEQKRAGATTSGEFSGCLES